MPEHSNHRRRHRRDSSPQRNSSSSAIVTAPSSRAMKMMNLVEAKPSFTLIMISACLYVLSGVSQVCRQQSDFYQGTVLLIRERPLIFY
jgi:hypothetical protein